MAHRPTHTHQSQRLTYNPKPVVVVRLYRLSLIKPGWTFRRLLARSPLQSIKGECIFTPPAPRDCQPSITDMVM